MKFHPEPENIINGYKGDVWVLYYSDDVEKEWKIRSNCTRVRVFTTEMETELGIDIVTIDQEKDIFIQ